jgi:hypothetical protein
MLRTWSVTYNVVDRANRDDVITTGVYGEQRAPNIINAAEKMRREVENDPELNNGRDVSAFVTSAYEVVTEATGGTDGTTETESGNGNTSES